MGNDDPRQKRGTVWRPGLRGAMRTIVLSLVAFAVACGPAPTVAPQPSPADVGKEPTIEQAVGDPFAVEGELAREDLPATMPELGLVDRDLPALPAGLPQPPATCAAFAARKPASMECTGRDAALTSLADALATTDVATRDAKLMGLEACDTFPPAMMRALRAEPGPTECGDVIVRAIADAPPAGTAGAVHDTLIGLGVAGMLSRAATQPPKMAGKPTKANVKAFIDGDMKGWLTTHATAIEQLSALGSQIRYYGKAVVAVEAGMADMRFVDAVRSVPVPEEFEKDDELREAFLQGLEDALGARKQRGRDAALVGLGSLATVGVLRDPRVDRARQLLSRMFGGRPMNALDSLLLPPLSPVSASGAEHRVAARLQTFYASLVFPAEAATDPALLRMLIEKGLSLPHRIALDKQLKTGVPNDVRLLTARVRLELGQNYWRRVDFDEATRLLASWPTGTPLSDDGQLILGVALALRGGHENAADMMVKAPLSDLGIGRVVALDTLVQDKGPHAGAAAFDAALIKKLAAPGNAPAAYWRDLAQRFRTAHELLADIRFKKAAEEQAREAEQTATAIEKMR